MLEFLNTLIRFFDQHNIPYMLSGSVAMSIYTLPRTTRDFDFVVQLKEEKISDLAAQFKEGYYFNEDAVRDAIRHKGIFNIIDHKSNYKADFVILKGETYRQTEFARRKQIQFMEMVLYIVSPEDLLISKLIWVQELQSALQMEDIKALRDVQNLDWNYIWPWISALNLNTFDLLTR